MLVVSSLISTSTSNGREGEMESFSLDLDGFSLLDDIDFDDIFIGNGEGDVLPDLEMDSDIFGEFSLSAREESSLIGPYLNEKVEDNERREEEDRGSGSGSGSSSGLNSNLGEEIVSKTHESVKVDWTPELHRRFVQAVEQLGMDKAVPSRILELMGIDCLTRHNIASHLQYEGPLKYPKEKIFILRSTFSVKVILRVMLVPDGLLAYVLHTHPLKTVVVLNMKKDFRPQVHTLTKLAVTDSNPSIWSPSSHLEDDPIICNGDDDPNDTILFLKEKLSQEDENKLEPDSPLSEKEYFSDHAYKERSPSFADAVADEVHAQHQHARQISPQNLDTQHEEEDLVENL
ncbi:hypothetical protein IFM89_007076 [Coptis chinensis]|uniref:HTH myb-type domain-containing protein n=1 Tax=Coptis chinensis TaxID=261450 RepID=A0A835IBK6_9MAGN|nr:hypothetical protein IFM89_007076 [Coptis chinensis]